MRRLVIGLVAALCAIIAVAIIAAQIPAIRQQVKSLVRPEAPPPITPLALLAPPSRLSATVVPTAPAVPSTPTELPRPTASITAAPSPEPAVTPMPPPTPSPAPSPTPAPVEVNGRIYEAYIPAAAKDKQFFQYTCEFDAAWVIFESFGRQVSLDEMLAAIEVDTRVEPYIEETAEGFVIHGGDISSRFSGDYRANFLARSTGAAMRKVFERFGLSAEQVNDRAGVEAALRAGRLVWMKTTVDFKPWRPAIWRTPEGQTFRTVLGNDHAVVVMGFNAESVVIRDVLGPTSSNWQRPYEYEVDWETFLRTWEAQDFDGLAVGLG